jgi:peptidoglycan/LPS O-acetylase OafA/YrhL
VPALDGLRGVAVAGVLLFHSGYLTGGYLGVDLFFVLSGFLITSLLLVESDSTRSVRLGGFWARRARRLLPALACVLLAVAAFSVLHSKPADLAQTRGDALATLGYVANWHAILSSQNYFALFNAPSPLQHTWSLAIEEQFYLVWPLVFVGLLAWWKAKTPKAVLVVALVGAAVSATLFMILYDPSNVSRSYYGTDTRAAGILLGGALAAALVIWGPVRARTARRALEVVAFIAIGVLAYAWAQIDGQAEILYRGGLLVCGICVVAVIAAAYHPTPGPISRVLSWRPLCLLGLISYGVYLWHWPIFIALDPNSTGIPDGPVLFTVRVVATLGIATLSYHLVEMPIRRGAGSFRQWRWLLPASAAALVVVVFVSTLGAKAPPAAGASPDSVAVAVQQAKERPHATRVMLVGDSVGYLIGVGMKQLHTTPGTVVLNRSVVACTFPYLRRKSGEPGHAAIHVTCDENWKSAVRRFKPQVVLAIFQCCSGQIRLHDQWVRPCDASYKQYATAAWEKAYATWGASGAQVYVTTAPYGLVEVFSDDAKKDLNCSNATRVAAARVSGAHVVDLAGWTCPGARPLTQGACRNKEGDVTLRPDAEHFEGAGARVVSRWLLSQTQTPTASEVRRQ